MAAARAELQRYPSVVVAQGHVETVSGAAGAFDVQTHDRTMQRAARLLLATGVYDALPNIEGLREAWGRTAFVCPYCDGWEVRDTRIAVLGSGAKAVELAQELWQWSRDILVCTQGAHTLSDAHQRWMNATQSTLVTQPVKRIHSQGGRVTALEFEDGKLQACDAVFLNAPLRPRYPLVDMLGCALRGWRNPRR